MQRAWDLILQYYRCIQTATHQVETCSKDRFVFNKTYLVGEPYRVIRSFDEYLYFTSVQFAHLLV